LAHPVAHINPCDSLATQVFDALQLCCGRLWHDCRPSCVVCP